MGKITAKSEKERGGKEKRREINIELIKHIDINSVNIFLGSTPRNSESMVWAETGGHGVDGGPWTDHASSGSDSIISPTLCGRQAWH